MKSNEPKREKAMNLANFKRIRIGSRHPMTLDVETIEYHERDGIYAYFYGSPNLFDGSALERAELRRKNNTYAIFLFRYKDMELPDSWKDSDLLWSLRNHNLNLLLKKLRRHYPSLTTTDIITAALEELLSQNRR